MAGLVAITAGCDAVTDIGATIIGLLAGTLLVYSVTFIDSKLHIDDPVGAVSVHGVCGLFGTLLVGLFAENGGLFYGGGIDQFVSQLIGVVTIGAWAFIFGFITFKILKATVGLRVPKRIEEEGLDIYEHGENAYN